MLMPENDLNGIAISGNNLSTIISTLVNIVAMYMNL